MISRRPYQAIDPSLPALQQTGRTVIVTGSNSGIGYAIARSFVKANAARVIILGRRKDVVVSAAAKLQDEGYQFGSGTDVQGRICDISDLKSTEHLWKSLESEGILVDVLVLSAASYGAIETILDGGLSKVWGDFESNFLVNISTCAAYMWSTMGPDRPTYGLTKNASTLFLQQIAQDTKPTDMQIVSFHPGGILTDSAKRVGGDNLKGLVFDDENLPGHFSVWTATTEASFIHGRFVRANWDVDELKTGPVVWDKNSPEWHYTEADLDRAAETFVNPDYVSIFTHVYKHRLLYAPGDPDYIDIEKALLLQPVISVPAVTLDGLADGNFPPTNGSSSAKYFSGPRVHHQVPGAGHNLPQEKPSAFVNAVLEVASMK
ncbi:peroxisomal short-chain alcohol dehydrogenase [Fusarium napiforme]|uniref:Peroxisomal short-chain alcohol dehydrogenase n=1 Tax=Fusarium napiforme TaxID=42672 RepID=A0A8H5MXH3_9HYPO|nr:peroxisomal short-chain alcohol dehydrogenase [Fusarium napiforme]